MADTLCAPEPRGLPGPPPCLRRQVTIGKPLGTPGGPLSGSNSPVSSPEATPSQYSGAPSHCNGALKQRNSTPSQCDGTEAGEDFEFAWAEGSQGALSQAREGHHQEGLLRNTSAVLSPNRQPTIGKLGNRRVPPPSEPSHRGRAWPASSTSHIASSLPVLSSSDVDTAGFGAPAVSLLAEGPPAAAPGVCQEELGYDGPEHYNYRQSPTLAQPRGRGARNQSQGEQREGEASRRNRMSGSTTAHSDRSHGGDADDACLRAGAGNRGMLPFAGLAPEAEEIKDLNTTIRPAATAADCSAAGATGNFPGKDPQGVAGGCAPETARRRPPLDIPESTLSGPQSLSGSFGGVSPASSVASSALITPGSSQLSSSLSSLSPASSFSPSLSGGPTLLTPHARATTRAPRVPAIPKASSGKYSAPGPGIPSTSPPVGPRGRARSGSSDSLPLTEQPERGPGGLPYTRSMGIERDRERRVECRGGSERERGEELNAAAERHHWEVANGAAPWPTPGAAPDSAREALPEAEGGSVRKGWCTGGAPQDLVRELLLSLQQGNPRRSTEAFEALLYSGALRTPLGLEGCASCPLCRQPLGAPQEEDADEGRGVCMQPETPAAERRLSAVAEAEQVAARRASREGAAPEQARRVAGSVPPLRRTQSRELGAICRGEARDSPERYRASALHSVDTSSGRRRSPLEPADIREGQEAVRAVEEAGEGYMGFPGGGGAYLGSAVETRGRRSLDGASRRCARTASLSPLSSQRPQQQQLQEQAQAQVQGRNGCTPREPIPSEGCNGARRSDSPVSQKLQKVLLHPLVVGLASGSPLDSPSGPSPGVPRGSPSSGRAFSPSNAPWSPATAGTPDSFDSPSRRPVKPSRAPRVPRGGARSGSADFSAPGPHVWSPSGCGSPDTFASPDRRLVKVPLGAARGRARLGVGGGDSTQQQRAVGPALWRGDSCDLGSLVGARLAQQEELEQEGLEGDCLEAHQENALGVPVFHQDEVAGYGREEQNRQTELVHGQGQGQGGGGPGVVGKAHRRVVSAVWARFNVLGGSFRDVHAEYEVDSGPGGCLGSGQFGVTRTARQRATGQRLACKSIQKAKLRSKGDVEDIRREVYVMKLLGAHPHIARFHDAFEDSEHVHILMELCEGGELFEQLQARGRYTEADAAAVTRTLLATLQYCHGRGIMHRDVKLENILLVSAGNCTDIKLVDFGIAALVPPGGQPLTEFMGTPHYCAPEVISGSYGPAADVWSVGVVLFALLSGLFPFGGKNNKAVLKRVASAKPKLSGGPWDEVSEGAKHLVQAMLASDPDLRITPEEALDHPWLAED